MVASSVRFPATPPTLTDSSTCLDRPSEHDYNNGHGQEADIHSGVCGRGKEALEGYRNEISFLIRSEAEAQLLHDPDVETRNRKPLKRPIVFGADWEFRLGPGNRFRVFYQVNPENREVRVLAVGVKDRSRLFFGGEEFEG